MPELNLGKRYFAVGKATVSLNETQKYAKEAIEKLIEDGVYEFESVPCICGSSVDEELLCAIVDRYGLRHHTVICQNCGLIRTNPRLTQTSYKHFYENWYRQLYSTYSQLDENSFRSEFEAYARFRGKRILEFLQNQQIDVYGKTVLEIGCAGGWNLSVLEKSGAQVIGFDYDLKQIEFGKKLFGLDLHYGGIKESINQHIKADIVILAHVVEHFTDPIIKLKNLIKLLYLPGGVCYLESPGVLNIHNSYIDPIGLLQNAHTYSFSKITLSYLVKRCEYEIQYCDEFIRMLCRPSNKEFADVEIERQHSKEVIEYLKDCEKKRIWRAMVKRCRLSLRRYVVPALKMVGIYPLVRKLYRAARNE